MSDTEDQPGAGVASPGGRSTDEGGLGDGDSDASAEKDEHSRDRDADRGAEFEAASKGGGSDGGEGSSMGVPSPESLKDGADSGDEEDDDGGLLPAWDDMPDKLEVDTDAEPTGEERVGQLLGGRYRITEYMGRGAMGDIFRAEHALMKKTVAVKVLLGEVTESEKVVERFRREAQAAANIDHPNVCVATDFGRTEEGAFFLVMEYLEGPTLQELVDEEGTLSVDRTLRIGRQIASALARAHEVGVVHRDLKPDNIMLVERGDDPDFVKILDFGIARVRMGDETPAMTKAGAVFGTPNYMSPEQAAGDPVDHRTDLYSLGGLMYEMLTGHPVFEADRGSQVMAMHVSEDPAPPSEESGRDVPRELDTLVLGLLSKDPDNRPQEAKALEAELEEMERRRGETGETSDEGEPVAGRTVRETRAPPTDKGTAPAQGGEFLSGLLEVTARWLRRGPAWVEWALFVALAVFGAGFVLLAAEQVVDVGQAGTSMEKATPEGRTSLAVGRAELNEDERVREAVDYFRKGAVGVAIDRLNAAADDHQNNAHLHYLLGRYHAAEQDWTESVAHYKQTLKLQPDYIERSELVRDLMDALGLAGDETADEVAEVVRRHLDRDRILDALGRTAWRDNYVPARKRATELLESTGKFQELPAWTRHSIRLRSADGCDEHSRLIKKVEETGAPEGIEVLEILDSFPRDGCGPGDDQDCYGCVRSDISRAMETLQQAAEAEGAETSPSGERPPKRRNSPPESVRTQKEDPSGEE